MTEGSAATMSAASVGKAISRRILVLNAGSSSLKFAVFDELRRETHGQVEGIGTAPRLRVGAWSRAAEIDRRLAADLDHQGALREILSTLAQGGVAAGDLKAVGHRIVHGGAAFTAPLQVRADQLAQLDALRALAPLHNGYGLDAIHNLLSLVPDLPQVACFDTAFHATQPDLATRLALPDEYHARGYRRYGFHGLNYEHVVSVLPGVSGEPLPRRLLVLHLGNGSSLCAIAEGRSVATSMGYSTLDGLVMGTRSGAIDPGVLLALSRDEGLDPKQLEDLLYRRSGLLALSNRTSDMRSLLDAQDADSRRAIEHFCYWAARHAGSAIVALQGVDAIVFTGGIGANAPEVRRRILAHLEWLGLALDQDRNGANEPRLSAPGATIGLWAIPADEELAIARHAFALMGADR
jgi:acetate kinase